MTEPVVIALIGVAGAVVGSLATLAGNFLIHWLEEQSQAKKEQPARELLEEMLNHKMHTWRKLETLMHVIGADEETTKRLLLELGARASEDGQPLWALKSRAPLG
jgi:thymidine phosphorylase